MTEGNNYFLEFWCVCVSPPAAVRQKQIHKQERQHKNEYFPGDQITDGQLGKSNYDGRFKTLPDLRQLKEEARGNL